MTTNGDIPMNSGSEENAKNGGAAPEGQSSEPESPPTVQASAGQSSEPESSLVVAVEEALPAFSNGKGKPPETLLPQMQMRIPLPDDLYSDTSPLKPPPGQVTSYIAALLLTGSIVPVPFVALVFTAVIYILPSPSLFDNLSSTLSWFPHSAMDIIYGFVITIVLWLLVSLFFQNTATRENIDAFSSNHIDSHLLALKALFGSIQGAQQTGNKLPDANRANVQIAGAIVALRNDAPSYYDASAEKVRECLNAVGKDLGKGGDSLAGWQWVS